MNINPFIGNTNMMKIANVAVVDPCGLTISINDVSLSDAGRDELGTMHPAKMGMKLKYEFNWNGLDRTNVADILSKIAANETFSLNCLDPFSSTGSNRSITAYCGDRTAQMVQWFTKANDYWDEGHILNTNFNCIQVDMLRFGTDVGSVITAANPGSMITLNNVALPDPAVHEWQEHDISDSSAGNDQLGVMHKMLICKKKEYKLEWHGLCPQDAAAITRAVCQTETFYGTLWDAKTDQRVQANFYRGDITEKIVWWPTETAKKMIDVSFDIIEV